MIFTVKELAEDLQQAIEDGHGDRSVIIDTNEVEGKPVKCIGGPSSDGVSYVLMTYNGDE